MARLYSLPLSIIFIIYNEQTMSAFFYGKYLLLNASFLSVLGEKKRIYTTYLASVLCYCHFN